MIQAWLANCKLCGSNCHTSVIYTAVSRNLHGKWHFSSHTLHLSTMEHLYTNPRTQSHMPFCCCTGTDLTRRALLSSGIINLYDWSSFSIPAVNFCNERLSYSLNTQWCRSSLKCICRAECEGTTFAYCIIVWPIFRHEPSRSSNWTESIFTLVERWRLETQQVSILGCQEFSHCIHMFIC